MKKKIHRTHLLGMHIHYFDGTVSVSVNLKRLEFHVHSFIGQINHNIACISGEIESLIRKKNRLIGYKKFPKFYHNHQIEKQIIKIEEEIAEKKTIRKALHKQLSKIVSSKR